MVLRLEIQLTRSLQIVQQRFQRPELAAQFAIESAVSGFVDERVRQLLMPNIDVAHRGERRAQVALRRRVSGLQQLIGDLVPAR